MTHALCGVVVPMGTTRDDAHDLVAAALEPFREEWHEGPTEDEGWFSGFWDWWCIGGRYTGRYSEYDPLQDDANYETCWLCHGTGERADGLSGPGNCNGCAKGGVAGLTGTGRMLLHPPKFQPCPDDVVPVKVLVNNPGIGLPLRIVFPDGTATEEEGPWTKPGAPDRDAWDAEMAERLRPFIDMALVVVDTHS